MPLHLKHRKSQHYFIHKVNLKVCLYSTGTGCYSAKLWKEKHLNNCSLFERQKTFELRQLNEDESGKLIVIVNTVCFIN